MQTKDGKNKNHMMLHCIADRKEVAMNQLALETKRKDILDVHKHPPLSLVDIKKQSSKTPENEYLYEEREAGDCAAILLWNVWHW